jgi:hypothetical protein
MAGNERGISSLCFRAKMWVLLVGMSQRAGPKRNEAIVRIRLGPSQSHVGPFGLALWLVRLWPPQLSLR